MISKKILPVLMAMLMFASIGASAAVNTTNISNTTNTSQVSQEAGVVKSYVEANDSLPTNITVGNQNISQAQFLYLLTTATQNVNSSNNSSINIQNVSAAPNPSENVTNGTLNKTEYVSLASKVTSFVTTNGRLPNYVTTSIGTIQYQNLVYIYSKILAFYTANNRLPTTVSVTSWAALTAIKNNTTNNTNTTNTTTNTTNNTTQVTSKFTISQIVQSASNIKSYVETDYGLPNVIQVGNQNVTQAQFLYLLTTALQNLNNGNNSSITIHNVSASPNPSENITTGTLTKSEYLTLSSTITAFISTYGRLPNYVSTSIGTMEYQSLIYMYSKILAFDCTNNRLPTTVSVASWYATTLGPAAVINGTANHTTTMLGSTSYGYVEKLGPFGNGTNKVAIIIGVHPQEEQTHIAMLNAIEALASTLKNVQIWVYQVVVYDGSDYNQGRAWGQDLASAYVVPNIDSSYKLVVDCHGNRGNYYVGSQMIINSIYAPANDTASVNDGNKLVNNYSGNLTYYVVPDGTSPQYVTIPIANKGIPALVYEQYMNQANYAQVLYANALSLVKDIDGLFASK